MAATLFAIIVIFYLGMMLFAWLFSNSMIFQPPPSSYHDGDQIIKLPSGDETISAIHLANPDARYTILVSHGNAVDLGGIVPILEELRVMGFSVFAYDYSGYGTSSGQPSEQHTYMDINAAYRHLTKELNIVPKNIIALGQSLGGGVAADLASRKPLGGLILESSFTTAYRVMTRIPLLPFDQYDTLSKLAKIDCPVLIIHGTRDGVIPFWHGKKLFTHANEPKQHYWVEGAGHNNLMQVAGNHYKKALQNFIRRIENSNEFNTK